MLCLFALDLSAEIWKRLRFARGAERNVARGCLGHEKIGGGDAMTRVDETMRSKRQGDCRCRKRHK